MDAYSGSAEDKKIYDLTEVYQDNNVSGGSKLSESRNNQEVIVVDKRGYERVTRDNNIHDLTHVWAHICIYICIYGLADEASKKKYSDILG